MSNVVSPLCLFLVNLSITFSYRLCKLLLKTNLYQVFFNYLRSYILKVVNNFYIFSFLNL